MPTPVRLKDIIEAIEMANDSTTYYLDRRTGRVELISDDITAGMEMEDDEALDENPEWLRESISTAREIQSDEGEHFVELPGKYDINDYEIMESFSRKYPNSRVSLALLDAIKGKGAFRRFNYLIAQFTIRDKWNVFQQHAYEEIAVDWLEANEIPYTRDDEIEVGGEM